MEEVLVPLIVFGTMPVMIWIIAAAKQKKNAELQKTVREAINQGKDLTPEVIRALGVKPRNPFGDLRWGVILIAGAFGFMGLGLGIQAIEPDENVFPIMAGVASFPGLIGLALIGLHFMLNGKYDQD